jgi:hypothetical protein
MTTDFRMMTREQVQSGLVMQLVPGALNDPVAADQSVFFSEDAFFFIEPVISQAWPAYRNYGHWGVSKIPAEAWRAIVEELKTLRQHLETARAPFTFDLSESMAGDVGREFLLKFDEQRFRLVAMINAMTAWLELHLASTPVITIAGI